ncbi:bifunctional 2',3'-cyclic-nucleotide 2'-phosphodiesterase/3'-nucleotidase [Frigidibacter albus]|uniref:Bifunctional 2',3'-cyclic-nucleotide 2'-phosphodiesterase/3'-nucleotidase n=1 Tax=Frigidibacter albus TaxID=1465486 RepID=A0A6L8VJC7_9RHOB|nr:bifunctional 2',3'-cyclic-nucleotide 2'-phosphodiesterase/3'-nucleotidase [Frigidibacter albus]NBE32402.1 bifunctional 2',3'-cyclic-nucleotide 2'-phosphodiesterase/3'-nucleotidase [Frigidibacter albus]GGH59578.1 2',3'-cyclic-nucleotide 2'-phosphodiesterase [Frigidibacter albus]
METTDLHVHVFPYDYYGDHASEAVGLARAAGVIDLCRAEAANALLFDNGDFLQGNPMGDYIAYERGMQPGDAHPIISAMNAVGYDAGTVGNHEFNYGLDFLANALAGAEFPLVSANVATRLGDRPTEDDTLLPPYVILDRTLTDGTGTSHPIRIGVIGFAPPQILIWDQHVLNGRLVMRDIVTAAEAWVPQMRADGCDLVLALNHSGIGASDWAPGMEHASVPLARVPGIDAVMTGHSHLVFPSAAFAGLPDVDVARGTLAGKPAVMAGFWGSHLGLIDLLLERGEAGWRVLDFTTEARQVSTPPQAAASPAQDSAPVLKAAQAEHTATLAYVRRPVGHSSRPLNSYFALVADDPALQLVCAAQRWHVAQALQDTEWQDVPLLSAAAPFRAGGRSGPAHFTEVPAGGIALRNVADLYVFPNTIRAVRVTGADLADWLERAAGLYRQLQPGQPDQPLLDPEFPSYNFDVIAGLSYEIDPTQPARFDDRGHLLDPAARRIRNLCHMGLPVRPDQAFVVATNSYRAGGGGGFRGTGPDSIVYEGRNTNRDVLLRYISWQGTICPCAGDTWRLTAPEGTSAVFDSSPHAPDHLAEVSDRRIELAGPGENGFARFRIRF